MLYPLFFVAVYLTHYTLLRLPYFWDEAGYYIPAALDLFHTGSLIPHSTLTNAHPPLPSLLLAGWWHLTGTTIEGTRTLVAMVAAAALLGVFRLGRTLAGTPAALAVAGLTALYPVWFAQSTLAHADLFAAAFSLWALSFVFEPLVFEPLMFDRESAGHRRGRLAAIAALFSLAALAKETAIITPVALALWEAAGLLFARRGERTARALRPVLAEIGALLIPVLPLALWYLFHYERTGFAFGNPEFLRYNATANADPLRVAAGLWHRAVHLFFHMNLWVPVVATLALLRTPVLPGRGDTVALSPPVLTRLVVIVLGNAGAFSVLGGALLTRYLLPLYPLVLLLCVAVWRTRVRRWALPVALTASAFAAALFLNPPYSFAPEDNLTYRDFVVLHQEAIAVIAARFPSATVLSAWPATDELAQPSLGYIAQPLKTVAIEDFSPAEIARAAADPGAYDTALVFSTKWEPPPGKLDLGRLSEATDERFFGLHHDLPPAAIARQLGGAVVWTGERHGEWAAVLRFPRAVEASLPHPPRRQADAVAID